MAFNVRNLLVNVLTKHVSIKPSSTFTKSSFNIINSHRPLSTVIQLKNAQSSSSLFTFENKSPLLNGLAKTLIGSHHQPQQQQQSIRSFHVLRQLTQPASITEKSSLFHQTLNVPITLEPKRTVIKFSYRGRRRTFKTIVSRFYRLQWGGWIHARPGRHHHVWKASDFFKTYKRQHVFVNKRMSYKFDKMVTKFWYKKKYYVDDPYESYHTRPNFPLLKRKDK